MTPRKNRPVLYEVIARSRGAREPIWRRWTSAGGERAAPTARAEPAADEPIESNVSTAGDAAPDANIAEERAAADGHETHSRVATERRADETVPALQMDKDGVVLTLSWPGVATVLVTLLLALAFAFQAGSLTAGSKSGAPPAGSPPNTPGAASPPGGAKPSDAGKAGDSGKTGASQKTPAKPDAGKPATPGSPQNTGALSADHRLAEVSGSKAPAVKEEPKAVSEETKSAAAAESDENAAAKVDFKPGYEYLIVQHFTRAQKDAAEAAEAFLKSNGIDSVLLRGRELTLVCTESFLLKQKDAAARSAAEKQRTQLKNRVRQLGTDFAKTYGFAFDQCYTRVMKQP